MESKTCSRCKRQKPLGMFPKRKGSHDGRRGTCKECRDTDRKKWLDNGGRVVCADIAVKHRKTSKSKRARLLRNYGITEDQWQTMFDNQSGRCLICEKHQSELKQTLNVDHCHETGKVRGLLCGPCNQALGLMKEDKDSVLNMGRYIHEYCE